MDVYLAAAASCNSHVLEGRSDYNELFLLDSYAYASDIVESYIPKVGKFLLDSGAFTFVASTKVANVDWVAYVDRYAEFIKKNNVSLFFELDIDKLIGYEAVLKLRKRLEIKAEKQCIPVWHKSRGKQAFIDMCKEYPYVSIGGLVGDGSAGAKEYTATVQRYFPWFIDTAHVNGARIHALGFTNFEGLGRYHFDSVDSASWTSGHRFGGVCVFDGDRITHMPKKGNLRMADWKAIARHNFNEWVKFQRYAKEHL